MSQEASQARIRAALITVQVLFGINYLASKFIVTNMAPGAWALVRTSGALLILGGIVIVGRRTWPARRDMLLLGVAGPLLTRLASREVQPRLVVALEDSGSMALEHGPDGQTRWQAGLALTDTLAEGLQSMGLSDEPWMARGNGLQPLRTFQRDDAVIPAPETHGTSLGGLLKRVKGATATNQLKPATTETGLQLKVPPFIAPGEKIKIDTDSGEYMERFKD